MGDANAAIHVQKRRWIVSLVFFSFAMVFFLHNTPSSVYLSGPCKEDLSILANTLKKAIVSSRIHSMRLMATETICPTHTGRMRGLGI